MWAALASLGDRLFGLESAGEKTVPSPAVNQTPQIIFELFECKEYLCKIIVHGLPESSELLPATRITNDHKRRSESIRYLSLSLPPKTFRISKINYVEPRLLKVVFPTFSLFLTCLPTILVLFRLMPPLHFLTGPLRLLI